MMDSSDELSGMTSGAETPRVARRAVRIEPAECPGCLTPLEAKYSQFRDARPHPATTALLVAGSVFSVTLALGLFWLCAWTVGVATAGMALTRRERGMLLFLSLLVTTPLIWWVSRLWWRFAWRLPRTCALECGKCRWTGACRVYADWT